MHAPKAILDMVEPFEVNNEDPITFLATKYNPKKEDEIKLTFKNGRKSILKRV